MYFRILLFALLSVTVCLGCKSIEKLYSEGDYSSVLKKLNKKATKGELQRKEKTYFIKAINNTIREQTDKIYALSESANHQDWLSAWNAIVSVEKQRTTYLSYPQIGENDINSFAMQEILLAMETKLYNYYKEEYAELESKYFETNNRNYIQKAYRSADQMERFGGDSHTVDSLKNLAVSLGHRVISYEFDADPWNSYEFRTEFEREINFSNTLWNTFTSFSADADYMLVVGARIVDKDEDRTTRDQEYNEQVVDYYNEVKDSLGNVISKEAVYKQLTARVRTIRYRWEVDGEANYQINDAQTYWSVDSGSIRNTVYFEDEINVFLSGDRDAVPANIDLSSDEYTMFDYDELIEECFEELGRRMDAELEGLQVP